MTDTPSPIDRIKLDKQVTSAMEAAVESTLTEMFSISPSIGACKIENDGMFNDSYVYSSMQMSQAEVKCGVFVLGFSRNLIHIILEKNGLDANEDESLTGDCVEELTNMIYGRLKRTLNKLGYNFAMELPEIITDKDKFVRDHLDKEVITLPFLVDGHAGKVSIAANL